MSEVSLQQVPGLPTFPTWPPPSGGAPVVTWELGPITSPIPYGGGQTPVINAAPPLPTHPYPSTFFPKKMPSGANGQNQSPPANWPTWPHSKVNVLPDKASVTTSQITPPPIMGPSSTPVHLLASQIGRLGPATKTFPAGAYIDGLGTVVTPTRIVGGLGN
jgi:hypothetical protein